MAPLPRGEIELRLEAGQSVDLMLLEALPPAVPRTATSGIGPLDPNDGVPQGDYWDDLPVSSAPQPACLASMPPQPASDSADDSRSRARDGPPPHLSLPSPFPHAFVARMRQKLTSVWSAYLLSAQRP